MGKKKMLALLETRAIRVYKACVPVTCTCNRQLAPFQAGQAAPHYLVHGLQLANDGQPDLGPVIFEQAEEERQQVVYRFSLHVCRQVSA